MSRTDATPTSLTDPAADPAAPTPGRARLEHLDGVRALAALYVLLHHIWITIWPAYPVNDGPVWVGWLLYGHLSVSVFIVVSGFSLAIAPARSGWRLRGGVRTFVRRRAWRILPTYWAALAFSCLVFGVVTADLTGDKVSLKAVVVHGLLLQDVVNSPKPNGAFWSIAVEWQIYFLFPLMLWVRRRFGTRGLVSLATVVVVGAYLGATTVEPLHRLLNLTPQFALLFAFGVAAATVLQSRVTPARRRGLSRVAVVGAGALVVGIGVLGSARVDEQYFWVDLAAGAVTAVALAALACGGLPRLCAVLGSRPLRSVGLFSYSVYCVHLPILWLVWHLWLASLRVSPMAHFLLLTGLGVPVALVGSWVFSLAFEKPFLTHRSFRDWQVLLSRRTTRP